MARYLMGIDNGGTLTKAAIYDDSGTEISVGERRMEMVFPSPGHTERDLDQLWEANIGAIRTAISSAGVDTLDIAAVAVTGHGNGLYLLAGDGRAVERGINSTDTRAQEYIARWRSDGTQARAYDISLIDLHAGQPPALLAWYRDNRPDVLDRTRWFLSCKDYVRYKLTGQVNTELTDLSGSGLMSAWTRELDPELFEIYGIGPLRDKIPPMIQSAEVGGTVTRESAEQTGLAEGTPVAGGLFDIVGSAVASGIVDPGLLCVVGGTWSINEFISPEPLSSPELSMNSLYCIPGYYLISESSPTSASNLEWFVTNVLLGESYSESDRREGFDACNDAVASTKPEDSDLVFFPYLFGSNTVAGASGAFLGLAGWHGRKEIIRAIYEGVAYAHRVHIDRLLRNARAAPARVRAAGGITRSPVWLQMFADVLGMPVETTNSQELGALGAAMSAGIAAGFYTSFPDAVDRIVRVSRVYEPDPRAREAHQVKYAKFQSTLDAMRTVWANTPDEEGGGT